jgi:hypothetical protein
MHIFKIMNTRTRFILAVFVAGLMAGTTPAAVTLVENGAPRAQVIVAGNATVAEKLAADELVRYVRKTTGAELAVRAQRTRGTPAVLIGMSAAPEPVRARVARLARDGFLVEARGDTVVLAGQDRNGTIFAVYEMLERFAGVRWLWPGEVGEVTPRQRGLTVADTSITREPAFVWRDLGPGGSLWGPHDRWTKERDLQISTAHQAEMRLWERRNRFGGENIYGGHAFGDILPPRVWGKTNPEYYALVNGRRDWENFNGKHRAQLCTSNPEVVQKTIEYCRTHFVTYPELDGISISPNDGRGFCECDNCTRLDTGRVQQEEADPEMGRAAQTRIITDRMVTFGNQVAEGVAQTHPDKKIMFYAYSQFHEPPERVKPRENLVMIYTVNSAGFWNEAARRKAFEEMGGWARVTPAFGVYEYHTQMNFPDMPRLIPDLVQLELKELQRLDARHFHTQAGNGFAVNGLNFYVLGKLLWEPAADVKAILADYVTTGFGPAAPAMARYFDRFIESWRSQQSVTVRMNSASLSDYRAVLGAYPRELREACGRDLDEALRVASGEHKRRVEFVRDGFRYFLMTIDAAEGTYPLLQAGWKPGDTVSPGGRVDPAHVDRALELWRQRERYIEEHREDFVLSYMWVKSGDETRSFNPLRRVRAAQAQPGAQ